MTLKKLTDTELNGHKKAFGKLVADWRRNAGLTQLALAEGLGFSRGFIQAIEDGRKRIALERMEIYAHALRKPVDELYEEHIRGHDPELYWFLRRLWQPNNHS